MNRCFARPPEEFGSAGAPQFEVFNEQLHRLHQDNPKMLWDVFGMCHHVIVCVFISCWLCKII
jgi:hypothetical protein